MRFPRVVYPFLLFVGVAGFFEHTTLKVAASVNSYNYEENPIRSMAMLEPCCSTASVTQFGDEYTQGDIFHSHPTPVPTPFPPTSYPTPFPTPYPTLYPTSPFPTSSDRVLTQMTIATACETLQNAPSDHLIVFPIQQLTDLVNTTGSCSLMSLVQQTPLALIYTLDCDKDKGITSFCFKCQESCASRRNGVCDDDGDICDFGTDCTDCGKRLAFDFDQVQLPNYGQIEANVILIQHNSDNPELQKLVDGITREEGQTNQTTLVELRDHREWSPIDLGPAGWLPTGEILPRHIYILVLVLAIFYMYFSPMMLSPFVDEDSEEEIYPAYFFTLLIFLGFCSMIFMAVHYDRCKGDFENEGYCDSYNGDNAVMGLMLGDGVIMLFMIPCALSGSDPKSKKCAYLAAAVFPLVIVFLLPGILFYIAIHNIPKEYDGEYTVMYQPYGKHELTLCGHKLNTTCESSKGYDKMLALQSGTEAIYRAIVDISNLDSYSCADSLPSTTWESRSLYTPWREASETFTPELCYLVGDSVPTGFDTDAPNFSPEAAAAVVIVIVALPTLLCCSCCSNTWKFLAERGYLEQLESGLKSCYESLSAYFSELVTVVSLFDVIGDTVYVATAPFANTTLQALAVTVLLLPGLIFVAGNRELGVSFLRVRVGGFLTKLLAIYKETLDHKLKLFESHDEAHKVLIKLLAEVLRYVFAILVFLAMIASAALGLLVLPMIYGIFVILLVHMKLSVFPAFNRLAYNFAGLQFQDEQTVRAFNLAILSEVLFESIPQLAIVVINTQAADNDLDTLFWLTTVGSALCATISIYPISYWSYHEGSIDGGLRVDRYGLGEAYSNADWGSPAKAKARRQRVEARRQEKLAKIEAAEKEKREAREARQAELESSSNRKGKKGREKQRS